MIKKKIYEIEDFFVDLEKPDGWTANFGDFIRFCEERGYNYEDDIEADIAFKEFLITELKECVIKDMPYKKAMEVIEDIEEELRVALDECHVWDFVKWVKWLREKYA